MTKMATEYLAHLGVTVAGFPNFFLLYGPNTNLGHDSIILMIECQAGKVTNDWSGTTIEYWWRTRSPDWNDFHFVQT